MAVVVAATLDIIAVVVGDAPDCRGVCVAVFPLCLIGSMLFAPLWVVVRMRRSRMGFLRCAMTALLTTGVAFSIAIATDGQRPRAMVP